MNIFNDIVLAKAWIALQIGHIVYRRDRFHIKNQPTLFIHDAPTAYTTEILQILKEKKIDAIFFIIGKKIKGNAEIMDEIVGNGFRVGNHSFAHKRLNYFFNFRSFKRDLEHSTKRIYGNHPQQKKYYSPPFGILSAKAHKLLIEQHYNIVFGDEYYDDRKIKLEKLKLLVSKALKLNRNIILHDGKKLRDLLSMDI